MASSMSIADQAVRPSRIAFPEQDLDDLQARLERTRWGDELIGAGSTTECRSRTLGVSPTTGETATNDGSGKPASISARSIRTSCSPT
jgi:hypothetical protein